MLAPFGGQLSSGSAWLGLTWLRLATPAAWDLFEASEAALSVEEMSQVDGQLRSSGQEKKKAEGRTCSALR